MRLKQMAISAVAVTAMVCAYADVEWMISADGYPNEYGVVGRNMKNPYSGDVVVPSEWVVDFKGSGLRGTITAIAPSGGITPAEAETVEVRDGKLRLGVKVERTDSLANPDWRPVAKESVDVAEDGAVEIAVPANVSSGFYRLQSKGR